MKITNKENLPLPLVRAVTNDPYNRGDSDFTVQSEIVRGDRRQYWVEDSRTDLKYRRSVTELTTDKRTADRWCKKLNQEAK